MDLCVIGSRKSIFESWAWGCPRARLHKWHRNSLRIFCFQHAGLKNSKFLKCVVVDVPHMFKSCVGVTYISSCRAFIKAAFFLASLSALCLISFDSKVASCAFFLSLLSHCLFPRHEPVRHLHRLVGTRTFGLLAPLCILGF